MSITDELRRLLDERGIEWKDFEGDPLGFVKAETAWGEVDELGNYNYWIVEYFDGTTLLNIGNPTPEQAVEATLGRGTCEMGVERTFERVDGNEEYLLECSECGEKRWWLAHMMPSYCPDCGRKVVDA